MTWNYYPWFALPAILFWLLAGFWVYANGTRRTTRLLALAGTIVFAAFMAGLWWHLERPPMRTLGETRLWYSFFIATVGLFTYRRWNYPWLISFTSVIASVFAVVNLVKPEIHSKGLMPALQSVWFVPHVGSYILSYALFGAATVGAVMLWGRKTAGNQLLRFVDNIVYVGAGFLMAGLLMGALWAKEAWGHYWSWDPKETWAFITSMAYLLYIHLRLCNNSSCTRVALWWIPVAFGLLMMAWLGVSYLPAARGSVHVYG